MARYTGSKCKQCRRAGEKVCNSAKCGTIKRNYPPGVHGPKNVQRLSDYGTQLREKQKTKHIYRILEKQFRRYFQNATKAEGDAGENLLRLLESRLDNVVFRLGFADTRDGARQYIKHKHIAIDGKKVSIPSYNVKPGQKINIVSSSTNKQIFKDLAKTMAKKQVPGWLELKPKDKEGIVKHLPQKDDLNVGVDSQLIVEYYSR
ncbi:30S ribosomal protein S4 [Patescibacteria group bacterium]